MTDTTPSLQSLHSRQQQTSSKRVNTIVRMADQAAVSKALEEAIKNAEECVEDCAANWDEVEEISAAQAHAKKEPAPVDAKISKNDLAFIKASQDALKEAKSGAMDKTVLDSIETAAKSLGQVQGKVKESARMKELSKSLEIALKAARECTDDCAVEWETVEEISDAKEREQAKGN
jgi:thiamine biosynthesis lipoprotein ApbE